MNKIVQDPSKKGSVNVTKINKTGHSTIKSWEIEDVVPTRER